VTTGVAGPTQAVLHHADGVELIGEMAGSGYRVPPSLVRRADGQTIQLTPLLYAILREVDGRRTPEELAEAVSEATGRTVNEDNIRHLVDKQLRPFGLLVQEDGSQPKTRKRNPLLALRFRYAVTDPDRTRRLTDPFRFLFRPWMAVPILAAFVVVCWWVFFRKGLAHAAYDAFQRPGLLILVFAITILSAGFHEFGHAAAARYGGATPGVMGFGVYLVWPAFYTDVTDTYRLGRRGRVRTDLGGLYFNAIVAVVITGLWWSLHYDALLLVVATQILQMLRQLAPMVRFDGYHVLADITGVPDLYSRIKPTLLGLLPWRWGDPHARLLKPWARILVTVWVMVVVPMLLSALAGAILAVPRLTGSAWSAIGKQQDVLSTAWADGDIIQATARVLAIIAIVIPVAGVLYMFVRIARQSAVGAWKATVGKPIMRALAILLGAAIMTGIAYAWWPGEGKYRPIQPWERGTVGDIAYALGVERMSGPRHATAAPRPAAASRALVKGQQGVMRAVWDTHTPPPTFTQPQLAVILVPKAVPGARVGGGGGWFPAATTTEDKGWVFPFDKPLTPGPDDTQALAVNTTDNTVDYEAAFAMIWVKDNSEAMNINDAEAYASCNSCGAVAVSYQVVFVLDTDDADNNVAAPENLAGALNYNCVNCLTYALAQQLFITLDRPLTEDEMKALDDVWTEMRDYEEQIKDGKVPLDEIDDQLAAYTTRIKTIVAPAIASTTAPSTAVQTASQTSPPTASSTVVPTPSLSSTATPTPSPTESPAASSTASPAPTSSASPTTASIAPTGTTSGPTPSSGSTSTGTTTDGSATGGSTASGGTTSGGSTSGGTAASP
jgi:putative peptide zinc metalloprotease protein